MDNMIKMPAVRPNDDGGSVFKGQRHLLEKRLSKTIQAKSARCQERQVRAVIKEHRKALETAEAGAHRAHKTLAKCFERVKTASEYLHNLLDPVVALERVSSLTEYQVDLRAGQRCDMRRLRLAAHYLDTLVRLAQVTNTCAGLAMDMAHRAVHGGSLLQRLRRKTASDYYGLDQVADALDALVTRKAQWRLLKPYKVGGVEQGAAVFGNVVDGVTRTKKTLKHAVQAVQVLEAEAAVPAPKTAAGRAQSNALNTLRASTVLCLATECMQAAGVLVSHGNSLRHALGRAVVWSQWHHEDGYGGMDMLDMKTMFAPTHVSWQESERADNSFAETVAEACWASTSAEEDMAVVLQLVWEVCSGRQIRVQ